MTATVTDLLRRAERQGECLVWIGWRNDDGYGYVRHDGRDRPVHRVAYELFLGPIPDSYEIDHRCRTRACIEPTHLEPVTHAEDQRRLSAAQTSCRRAGHDWSDPKNVRVRPDGRRWCAECDRIAQRARHAARKAS